jgi:hypothetical protein
MYKQPNLFLMMKEQSFIKLAPNVIFVGVPTVHLVPIKIDN